MIYGFSVLIGNMDIHSRSTKHLSQVYLISSPIKNLYLYFFYITSYYLSIYIGWVGNPTSLYRTIYDHLALLSPISEQPSMEHFTYIVAIAAFLSSNIHSVQLNLIRFRLFFSVLFLHISTMKQYGFLHFTLVELFNCQQSSVLLSTFSLSISRRLMYTPILCEEVRLETTPTSHITSYYLYIYMYFS